MGIPTKRQTWKAVFAVMAALAVVGTAAQALSRLIANLSFEKMNSAQVTSTTSAAPAGPQIKPLSVRPVVSAFVTTADQCPPSTPVPADQPLRIYDIEDCGL